MTLEASDAGYLQASNIQSQKMNQRFLRIGLVSIALLALAYAVWEYRQPRFGAGDAAPDFEYSLMNGKTARLSDLKGHYVLLQFWGSWCGPCRQENMHLVQLYRKYHNQGFDICSIGLESNPNAWKNAILNDQLEWSFHSMESADFDGPITSLYNIKSIPSTFLLNPQGVIMGVNLRPEYLEKMLSEKLQPR